MSYPADPHWANVKNLLHFDGVNGGKRIADEKNNVWTVGSTSVLSSAQKKFGSTSLYCDGSSNGYVSLASTWIWGTNDLTIGLWIYPLTQVGSMPSVVVHGSSNWFAMAVSPTGHTDKVVVYLNNATHLVSGSSIQYNTWSHVAFIRTAAGATKLYINGVLEASGTTAYDPTVTANTYVGHSSYPFRGYIADYRYTFGVNRYPTNFTPPTAAFPGSGVVDPYYDKVVLHMPFDAEHGAREYKDLKNHLVVSGGVASPGPAINVGGPSNPAFGNSVVFMGSLEYWLKTTSNDFNPGTQDFCIEGRCSTPASTGVWGTLFRLAAADGVTAELELQYVQASNTMRLYVKGVLHGNFTPSGYMATNTLTHWAVCRTGSSIEVFENGIKRGSTYNIGANPISSSGDLYLFGAPSSWPAYGAHDDIRFTIGNSRYTATFTPPTAPHPRVGPNFLSGTVLDSNNTPLARTVRAFRRSDSLLTDETVSDATTGAFELRATDMSEHYVLVFDDNRNAMVYDHIEPVV